MSKERAEVLTVGLIGARGFVGRELIAILNAHPLTQLVYASSREMTGRPISAMVPEASKELLFENITPDHLPEKKVDVCFLALPNGYAAPYVAAIDASNPSTVIVDLSADYRFTDEWVYGLVEHNRAQLHAATRISNPGCYATAMQLAIRPFLEWIDRPPACFGVSGFSGAGTKPSPKTDPKRLKDNLLPYALAHHIHEEEVSRHLQMPVHFSPHVAAFYRGISMTIQLQLNRKAEYGDALSTLEQFYAEDPLVEISRTIPEIAEIRDRHGARIGGITLADDGRRMVLVTVIDNLLKGAATQAVQNMNVACGMDELKGITNE